MCLGDKVKKSKKPTTKEANPVGRPTDYKPEYCQMLIDHMAQLNPYQTFGAIIGVSKTTLNAWEKEHPEFLAAKKIALLKCEHAYAQVVKGQMRGIKSMDKNGNVVDYSKGSGTAMVWFGKNVLGWRDEPVETDEAYEDMDFIE